MGPIRPRRIEADGGGGVDRYKWDEAGTQAPRRHSGSGRCAQDGITAVQVAAGTALALRRRCPQSRS